MKRAVTILGLATTLGLVACGGSRRPPEPVVGPTGYVYPLGTPPSETRFSQTATLYFRDGTFERSLELALEGVEDDPGNPIHYLLAGMSYLRLGDYENADAMFVEAQRIYPAYELDIEPQREAAWGQAFNSGLAAYGEGDVEATIGYWNDAIVMYDIRPEAHRNLAGLLATEGRYDEAIEVYRNAIEGLHGRPATLVYTEQDLEAREVAASALENQLSSLLMLTERYEEAEPLLRRRLDREPESVEVRSELASALNSLGRESEARIIYSTLLSEGGLQATELFNLGVGLFRVSDFAGAAEAFRRLTEVRPQSRDAWFNLANALFAMEDWEALLQVGDQLLEVDPLGENALLISARARLESGDREAAVRILQRVDAAPVHLEGLRLRRAGANTTVEGRMAGNLATPGSPVELLFTFFGDRGLRAGTVTTTVGAPEAGATEAFVVTFVGRGLSYRYELLSAQVPEP